ncbi:GNAT family N-acetyltransferase [Lewinellaceae bacterium SD302]|nr:GNAT family N-acetyltransferase [Lewinellaceae bacterium SD302]
MNLQPTLSDELVTLRPLVIADYEALRLAAADPLIWELHKNGQSRSTPEGFEKFFNESITSGGAFVIIDRENDKIIGSSRYKLVEGTDRAIEIGWTFLARAYWGGVYNHAIKRLMIDYAHQHFSEVFLNIAADNFRSQGAARKIGAQLLTDYDPPSAIRTRERNNALTFCIFREDQ